jgi:hypothetical protein
MTGFSLSDRVGIDHIGENSSRRRNRGALPMKRSRRVVLTLMGGAAIGAVSMGFAPRRGCRPGREAVPGADGRLHCRAIHGGFGGTIHRFHGHAHGHGHGHGGG